MAIELDTPYNLMADEKSTFCGSDGLQSSVLVHGSNFSVGPRQFLFLPRAVLRSNRIMIMDKATATVDPQWVKVIGF